MYSNTYWWYVLLCNLNAPLTANSKLRWSQVKKVSDIYMYFSDTIEGYVSTEIL